MQQAKTERGTAPLEPHESEAIRQWIDDAGEAAVV